MNIFTRIKNWLLGEPETQAAPSAIPAPHFAVPPSDSAATGDKRPRVLISGGSDDSKSVTAMNTQLQMAGFDTLILTRHADAIEKYGSAENAVSGLLAHADALVVMGNDRDVPPESYGQQPHPKTKSLAVNDDGTPNMAGLARRAFEKIAMKQAMDCGIPVNGVCAAMQSVNVDGGGDLIQHVEGHSQVDDKIPPFVPVQFVQIQPDTQLADITGATPGAYVPQRGELPPEIKPVNSIHHQAVKTVRPDFVVSAISDDGHIEGIEPKDKSIKARFVQWHPEFGDSDVGPKLAGRLYDDALAYAKSKPQQEAPEIPEGLISNKVSLGKMAAMIMQRRQNAQMQLG